MRHLLTSLAVALTVFLAGCGDESPTAPAPEQPERSEAPRRSGGGGPGLTAMGHFDPTPGDVNDSVDYSLEACDFERNGESFVVNAVGCGVPLTTAPVWKEDWRDDNASNDDSCDLGTLWRLPGIDRGTGFGAISEMADEHNVVQIQCSAE